MNFFPREYYPQGLSYSRGPSTLIRMWPDFNSVMLVKLSELSKFISPVKILSKKQQSRAMCLLFFIKINFDLDMMDIHTIFSICYSFSFLGLSSMQSFFTALDDGCLDTPSNIKTFVHWLNYQERYILFLTNLTILQLLCTFNN